MAYFSSGSDPAGYAFDRLCHSCQHGWDPEKREWKKSKGCPVWLLQSTWNYDQGAGTEDDSEAEKARRLALDILVPNKDEVLCAMYTPLRKSNE